MIGDNIAARLRVFAAGTLRLCRDFPGEPAASHISKQLMRAATSGGANYEEARGSESRADFIHKLAGANKELLESRYWLGLAQDAGIADGSTVQPLLDEANQLIAILTASIRTAKYRTTTQPRR